MDQDFVVNQSAWLLSALTEVACRNVSLALADMIEDSAELSEIRTSPEMVKSLIDNIRRACEVDERKENAA